MAGAPKVFTSSAATTTAAATLIGVALVVGVAIVTLGADTPIRVGSPPLPDTPPGLQVSAAPGCDDARTPDQVRDAATPWCTIDRAVAAAGPHETIVVGPGTYGAVTAGPGAPLDIQVVARDLRRPPVVQGARLVGVQGYRLRGLRFSRGVSFRRVQNVTIADSVLRGGGIYVRQSSGVTIARNRITGARGETRGIMLQGRIRPDDPENARIRIVGNRISDVDHDAIGVYNGYRDLVIANNRIEDVHQPGGVAFHSDALQMMGGDDALVEGNVIQDATHGIIVKDGAATTGLVVRRNLVVRVGGAAMQLYNAPGALIERNTMWSSLLGVVLDDAADASGSTSVRLFDNVLQDVSARTSGAVAGASGNVIGRGATVGRRVYRGRPRFIDPARGDYRLRTANPGAGIRPGTKVPGAQGRATS